MGAEGEVPGDSRAAGGAASCTTTRKQLLDEIVAGKLLQARGVYGFWPAAADGDDIVLEPTASALLHPAPAVGYGDSRPNRSLADYISPAGDHLGAFAVTAGIGADELAARYEAEHDDYRSIMVKALADRLAEAFAEYLHEVARREWYETARSSRRRTLAERYRGIRPAFGYPACPDHSEKRKLFELLDAERVGHRAHRVVRHDPGGERQRHLLRASGGRGTSRSAGSAATRSRTTPCARGCRSTEAERWLRPNLGYEPTPDITRVAV